MKRAAVARFWRWGGWDFGVRFVHLYSSPNSLFRNKDGCFAPPSRSCLGEKFLRPKSLVPAYLDEIVAFRSEDHRGYAFGLACLANFALDRGIRLNLKGTIDDVGDSYAALPRPHRKGVLD